MKYSRGPTAVGGWGHCCHHLVPLATCVHGCPCSNAQGAEHHRWICCPLEAALLPGVPISIWTGMLGLAGNCPGPRAVPGATTGRKVALAGAQHQQRGCCYITRHRARHGDNPLCLPQRLLLHQTWARLARRQHGPVPQHPIPPQGAELGQDSSFPRSIQAHQAGLCPSRCGCRAQSHGTGSREVSWRMDRACCVALSFTG